MNEVVIILQSETFAIKAKKILKQLKIPARVVNITSKKGGCQRGIEIPSKDFFTALSALRENGIEYQIT